MIEIFQSPSLVTEGNWKNLVTQVGDQIFWALLKTNQVTTIFFGQWQKKIIGSKATIDQTIKLFWANGKFLVIDYGDQKLAIKFFLSLIMVTKSWWLKIFGHLV